MYCVVKIQVITATLTLVEKFVKSCIKYIPTGMSIRLCMLHKINTMKPTYSYFSILAFAL